MKDIDMKRGGTTQNQYYCDHTYYEDIDLNQWDKLKAVTWDRI